MLTSVSVVLEFLVPVWFAVYFVRQFLKFLFVFIWQLLAAGVRQGTCSIPGLQLPNLVGLLADLVAVAETEDNVKHDH